MARKEGKGAEIPRDSEHRGTRTESGTVRVGQGCAACCPRERGQGETETGKGRANACVRKINTKIRPLVSVRSLMVTLAKQGHSGTRAAAGLMLGDSRESQNEFRVSSKVQNAWSASIQVSLFFHSTQPS